MALFSNTVRVRDDFRQSPAPLKSDFPAQRRLSHPFETAGVLIEKVKARTGERGPSDQSALTW